MILQVDKSILWWMKKIKRKNLDNILLVFTPTGIKVTQAEDSNAYSIDGFLSRKDSSIVNFAVDEKTEFQLPIPEFGIFCELLGTFGDLITFEASKTHLTMRTEKKVVNYQLVELEFIKGAGKLPKAEYDEVVKIKKSVLDSVVKDASLLDSVKVVFDQVGKTLKILVEGGNHKAEYIENTDTDFNRKVVLPFHTLAETVGTLSEEQVELVFANGVNSLQIKEKSDIFYMVTSLAGVVQ